MLQYGSTTCLSSCAYGTYANSANTQCYKCSTSCANCMTTATNCISCGLLNGVIYYLNTVNNANICLQNCGTGLYEVISSFTCALCDVGCLSCDISSSNCTQCTNSTPSSIYYKQPNINQCLLNSCPSQYFKNIDYSCVLCRNGSYGDGSGGTLSACTLFNCVDGCASCYSNNLNSCYSCKNDANGNPYFLQPYSGSTICSNLCPNGYFGNTTSFIC